ncbi:hypothetical protein [Rheinheimera texasensis]|uniref:general secretion pathway protein GspK n=1 Tax=Rheinheimera texasensis TaxID=306205 RepID=UPI0032B2BA82
MNQSQRGIALLQVLFLSMILSVMLISMHLKAKAALTLAQELTDRAQAELQLYSADAEFKFVVLSQPLTLQGSENGQLQWNLHDEPFAFAGINMQVQDVSGLINLYNYNDMARLFRYFNDESTAAQLVGQLQDWQDDDNDAGINGAEQSAYPAEVRVRNQLMQTESEIRFLKSMTPAQADLLLPWLSTAPQSYQNPLVMPDLVLQVMFGKTLADQLTRLRQTNKLDGDMLRVVMGAIHSDDWVFGPSGSYRVTFTSQVNNVKLSRRYTIRLSPYQEDPFTYWEYVNQYHAENR